jgi:hypothetical protein
MKTACWQQDTIVSFRTEIDPNPQALAIAGAFYFFNHCLITPKCHPILGTIELKLDKTRSLK